MHTQSFWSHQLTIFIIRSEILAQMHSVSQIQNVWKQNRRFGKAFRLLWLHVALNVTWPIYTEFKVRRCTLQPHYAFLETQGVKFVGWTLFSFCLRLQNQTWTTSFSICNPSATAEISSAVGFEFCKKNCSSARRTVWSMFVRFFRLRASDSAIAAAFALEVPSVGTRTDRSEAAETSSSHFWSRGFNLHIFLKLRFNASNLDIVVWLKSLPYNFPIVKPTSHCVKPAKLTHTQTLQTTLGWIKNPWSCDEETISIFILFHFHDKTKSKYNFSSYLPSEILRRLKFLANLSTSCIRSAWSFY